MTTTPPSDPIYPAVQPGAQPEQPAGSTGEPQQPSKAKKALGFAVPVAVAAVVGGSWLIGPGDPEVGECVKAEGESSFAVVDCDGDEAEHRIVGIQEGTQTEAEFFADEESCKDFPATEMVLWNGEIGGEGTVLCAEPV